MVLYVAIVIIAVAYAAADRITPLTGRIVHRFGIDDHPEA